MGVEVSQVGICRCGLFLPAKKVLSTLHAISHQVKLILTLGLILIWLVQALIASIVDHFTIIQKCFIFIEILT